MSITLAIHNEKDFRRTAYTQAIKDGVHHEDAACYLDEESKSLGECAAMILDPGVSPNGSDILGSDWDENEVPA